MESKIQAAASSLPELFSDIGRQVVGLYADPLLAGETLREKIALEASTLDELLQRWVNRLIEFLRQEKLIFSDFRIQIDQQTFTLKAEMMGGWVETFRDEASPIGATCTQASITPSSRGFEAVAHLSK